MFICEALFDVAASAGASSSSSVKSYTVEVFRESKCFKTKKQTNNCKTYYQTCNDVNIRGVSKIIIQLISRSKGMAACYFLNILPNHGYALQIFNINTTCCKSMNEFFLDFHMR